MRIDPQAVEAAAKELYIRALKILPDDVKRGFEVLAARESDTAAQAVLGTMIRNIAVAEQTDNLLCQDTGIPIYNVIIGRGVEFGAQDGLALKAAIRRGCERATREHPLRSSIVHPLTRHNAQTSCGVGVPVIEIDVADDFDGLRIEMIPKGSGSENNSWLKMAVQRTAPMRSRPSSSTACSMPVAGPARRPSSASASAARRICACIWPSAQPPGRWARVAPMRRARGSKTNCRRQSICSVSDRRGSAAMRPPSPCTSSSPPRISP
jgi:hypothetical protein